MRELIRRIEEGKNLCIRKKLVFFLSLLLFYFLKKKHEKQNFFSRSQNFKTKRNFNFFFSAENFIIEETTKSVAELAAWLIACRSFCLVPNIFAALLRRIKCLVEFPWFAKDSKRSAKISLWFLLDIYTSMVKTWSGDIKKSSK